MNGQYHSEEKERIKDYGRVLDLDACEDRDDIKSEF